MPKLASLVSKTEPGSAQYATFAAMRCASSAVSRTRFASFEPGHRREGLRPRRGHGLGDAEGVRDDPKHLLARAFRDRLQAAELEAREPDSPGRPHDLEAEVGEEVLRE